MSNINISATAATITNTPSTSPTTFSAPRPEKRRKSKDESPSFNGNNNVQPTAATTSGGSNVAALASQLSGVKKPKNLTSPCAISPVLLECPEQDCSKKYKHANGLKYHQSHAHGIISNADDDSLTAPDSPSQRSQSPPNARPCEKVPIDASFTQKINFESGKTSSSKSDSKSSSSQESTAPAKVPVTPVMPEHPLAQASGESSPLVESVPSSPFAEAILKPSNTGISTTSTPNKPEAQNKSEI